MNEENLIRYYNKFNEDKRLNTRHGNIEFMTACKYIEDYLSDFDNPKLIDIGAGTGKYSIYFNNKDVDVTAIELVKHNLRVLEEKCKDIKAYQGNALDLSRFSDNSFDITLLFGPMYHLISYEDKLKALMEAKRITKKNGYIFISYCMNEYCVLNYGFIENNIKDCIKNNMVDSTFKITPNDKDLYSMVRIEDIDSLRKDASLKRVKIIAQDGPTEYMKKIINNMDTETFDIFYKYHLSICERYELLGSSRHILDILKK